MEIVKFVYNDQEVEFQPMGLDNVMVNATQMAKVFGKRIDHFLKTDHAQEFIKVLELTPFGGSSEPLSKEEIIKTVNGVSTFMHRILALKFAAWLDPQFELWVYTTIDKLINHYYREHRDALIEKMSLAQQKEQKKQELLTKYPEAIDYFKLEALERTAKIKTIKVMRKNYNQLALNFNLQNKLTDQE